MLASLKMRVGGTVELDVQRAPHSIVEASTDCLAALHQQRMNRLLRMLSQYKWDISSNNLIILFILDHLPEGRRTSMILRFDNIFRLIQSSTRQLQILGCRSSCLRYLTARPDLKRIVSLMMIRAWLRAL